ncbi:MAG: hypothetical protein IJT78_04250 [Oscillospiraceae bacterium]|nr:hypothetical protein [Oscillospiraceae bacterium]
MTDEELDLMLSETGRLLRGVKPVEGEEYSLEDILAEYGQGGAEPAPEPKPAPKPEPKPAAKSAPPDKEPAPSVDTVDLRHTVAQTMEKMMHGVAVKAPEKKRAEPAPKPEPKPAAKSAVKAAPARSIFPAEPEGKRTVPLEKVMSQTVESVLDEDDAILEPPIPLDQKLRDVLENALARFRAARRRRQEREDTESLWEKPERAEPEEEPEPDLDDAVRDVKRRCAALRSYTLWTAVFALLLLVLTATDAAGWTAGLWSGLPAVQALVYGLFLLLTALSAVPLWQELSRQVRRRRPGCEAAAAVSVLVSVSECIRCAISGAAVPLMAASPAVFLFLCMEGTLLESERRRETFRLAQLGGVPPFGVSVTAAGSCKRRGTLKGLYRLSMRPDPARRWQRILAPLYVAVTAVLAGVVSFSRGEGEQILRVWSLLLAVAIPFSLPLTGALPLRYLTRRLAKSGCAVAGYAGARMASRSRRVVVCDNDLFPPGTVGLNGLKVFGEEIGKVVSYAASVTSQAHSQLTPLFEELLTAEGGCIVPVHDMQFYEEGGVGGTIRGESVMMGSAYFMRKHHVTLPQELKLKTGVFLAVDGALIAIFAIKYQPSRNVEWALRALRRNRIEPVMATRSCNVTPPLLRRKFNLDAKPIYPNVSTRLALSEQCDETAQIAPAIIYREGLMPLTEVVVGGRRMTRSVTVATVLAYLGGLCGLLLAYYLTSVGAWEQLEPLRVLGYQALWLLPTWLLSSLVKHY